MLERAPDTTNAKSKRFGATQPLLAEVYHLKLLLFQLRLHQLSFHLLRPLIFVLFLFLFLLFYSLHLHVFILMLLLFFLFRICALFHHLFRQRFHLSLNQNECQSVNVGYRLEITAD